MQITLQNIKYENMHRKQNMSNNNKIRRKTVRKSE